MQEININTDYIKLQQALKLTGVISQGSDVKVLIQEGLIKVNGSIEYQRGKKLKQGDIIEIEGNTFRIVRNS